MSQTPPDHETSEHDERDEQVDQQLVGRLRRADPATGLAPLGEDALQAMLRATTGTPRIATSETAEIIEAPAGITTEAPAAATDVRSAPVSSLSQARRRRRRWTGAAALGLAAAAAGVIAIGGGLPGLSGAAGGGPEVTALRAAPPSSDGLAVSCAPIDASYLAGRDLAFQGTVSEVRPVEGGEVVVLDVERVYRGDVGRRVEVSTPGAETTVDGTVELVAGQDYLVAASEGTVSGCGATGLVSPELEDLYAQAFGGGS